MLDLVLFLFLAAPPGFPVPSQADRPEVRLLGTRVAPEVTSTGETLSLELLIFVEEGWRLLPPDTLSYLSGAKARRPVEVRRGAAGQGGGSVARLTYELLVLRPGVLNFSPIRVGVEPVAGSDPPGSGRWNQDPLATGGRTWLTLTLGETRVGSVLPPGAEAVEPAGPLIPPSEPTGRRGFLLGFFLLLAVGSGAGAWIIRHRGPQPTRGGRPCRALPFRVSISGEEARRQLLGLLADGSLSGQDAPAGLERAYELVRAILYDEAEGVNQASTSTEILASLGTGEGWDGFALAPLLVAGDGVRFGGRTPTKEQTLLAEDGLRRWLAGSYG